MRERQGVLFIGGPMDGQRLPFPDDRHNHVCPTWLPGGHYSSGDPEPIRVKNWVYERRSLTFGNAGPVSIMALRGQSDDETLHLLWVGYRGVM